tara:strand:- start:7676 stop:8599 length:924 start_codon:yes stop_codon:yes gene_type:complete
MMKPIHYLSILFLFFACKSDPKSDSSGALSNKEESRASAAHSVKPGAGKNLNISLLLDLSDRINPEKYPNPSMEYYQRDAAYIQTVATAFKANIQQKKIILIDDQIQLFFAPEPLNPEINTISKDLKYSFNKANISNDRLALFEQHYKELPTKIYELAILDDHYVGSDTWKFMNQKVKDYCISEDYRNILVILTDGYIYHKDNLRKEGNQTTYLTPEFIRSNHLIDNNWNQKYEEKNYGFIPANTKLNNLEVLVLGINPDAKNDFEDDVIKRYWSDWLESMGVVNYKIYNADLPSNMQQVINKFIQS